LERMFAWYITDTTLILLLNIVIGKLEETYERIRIYEDEIT